MTGVRHFRLKTKLTLLTASLLALVAWQRWAVGGLENPIARAQQPNRTDAAEPPQDADENPVHALALAAAGMDAGELRQQLQFLPVADLRSEAGQLLLRRWVDLNPREAIGWVESLADTAARQQLLPVAALAWSESDFPAALIWARSVTEGADQLRLIADLGHELVRTDPVGALDLAALLPETGARDEMELHAVRQWAGQDAAAATAWATRQPPGLKRERALAAVAVAMAEADAPRAAQMLTENMQPGPESYRAAIGIVQRWARADYPAALEWVRRFPNGSLRAAALAALAEIPRHTI